MSDQTIGVIPGVCNLEFNIKFSEPSEISFDIPSVIDGKPNWLYDRVSGHKIVYTEHYGIYITMNPETEADGISEIKHVKGYSIEKELDTKKFFLEEGTFKFYDQTNADNSDTIIGRILEIARGWSVGYVSPSLAQRYRTFDQYDNYLLSFIYDDAPEKFRCVFVFDPYGKTISAYDADETVDTIPIYLDFDNLVEELGIEEVSDELVTAIRPYGADELDIRDVNPIGTNWIYDLSHFISNGDIPSELASKWNAWQETVLTNREYYRGLTALRASATANLLAAQAALTDLNGELDTLTAQQSVTIQALAMETTASGIAYQQGLLDEINAKIAAKNQEIAEQKSITASLEDSLDSSSANSYAAQIQAVVDSLAITKFFTDEEYETLCHYFIEQDITESTFVATSVDTSVSGASYTLSGEKVAISGSDIVRIDLTSEFGKRMYTLAGGIFSMTGKYSLGCDIIRGTMEEMDGGKFVLSLYAGSITAGNTTASSGVVTISGTLSNWSDDIHEIVIGTVVNEQTGATDQITEDGGSTLQFTCQSGSLYLTASVSDYQKYSVQMELYDYAVDVLNDLATPTYEFSMDSGNFIFSEEFAPFRNELELGKGVYLNVGNKEVITPYIIEFELDFEDRSKFSIVFSNRFKRHDNCNTLKDMIEQSYSTSRSFDASKYIYNQAAIQASAVSQFMSSSLDAAKNTILAAANQSVVINGAGIHVGGSSNYQLRIVDSMIAMTDDNWAHAKLAIGLFASEDVGTYFGVNAEVIGGKLIVGNNLVIENETDTGVMQFKVDSTGAWLYNATFILQSNSMATYAARAASTGGCIILDPNYGIVAGNGNLFTTSGTTVTPSFIDSDGDIIFDTDGMPENSNFYLDIRDGNAYFRGTLTATAGEIGGFTIESDYLYTGSSSSFVALNGSGTNTYSAYAIWAGAANPNNAPFWVKKNGDFHAKNGDFSGTLSAATISGNLTADTDTGGWLIGCGINVNNGAFYVDQSGNVTMKGSINLSSGSITWGTSNSPVRVLYARTALSAPTLSYASYPSSSSYNWHQTMSVAYDYYASYSYDGGSTWTAAILIQGRDGEDGHDGKDGSDATVNEKNVFNVLTNGGTKFGIFSNSTANKLYINANYIQTGTLNANLIELSCSYGGFCKGYGSTGTRTTYGAMMYGSNGMGAEPYFIVTNAGCRMSAENDIDFFITGGGIYAAEEISVGSDRRLKNSIEYDMERYERFFMSLKPTQYRLNRGSSGRYHTGFIAQDVERALLDNGLTTADFAGLTIIPVIEVNEKDGIEDNYYKLRYGEFISLNTYMIQKLYRRIDELEAKIMSME